jgi:hypothetical protein
MPKRTYDIRLRNAVARSGDAGLFPELEIPRSTALEWIRLGISEVITHPSFEWSHDTLVEKIAFLERSLEAEKAKNRLVKCSLPDQIYLPKAFPNKNHKQGNACHQRTRHHKRVHPLQHQLACDVCQTSAHGICIGNRLVPHRA